MNGNFSFVSESLSVSANRVICNNMAKCHTHTSYELYFLMEGERYLFVDGAFYTVHEGDIFLIPPGVEHRTLDSGRGEYRRLTANISESTLPRSASCDAIRFVSPSERGKRRLYTEAREITETDTGSDNAECLILGGVMKMLSALMSEPQVEARAEVDSPTLARMSEILAYIDAHATEPLSLTSISERFFISEFYLCRLFREYTGRTMLDYITDRRVGRAEGLLSETDWKISSVAALSGFGSVSAFGTAFKRRLGVTPREYRREKRTAKKNG